LGDSFFALQHRSCAKRLQANSLFCNFVQLFGISIDILGERGIITSCRTKEFKEGIHMDKRKKIIISISAALGCLLVIYLGFSVYFMSHFYFRTTINGVDVSGKDVNGAKAEIQTLMDTYELTIEERDGTKDSIIGKDFGLETNWNNEVDNYLDEQNGFAWIAKLFVPDKHEAKLYMTFDTEKLNSLLNGLSCMDAGKLVEPQNAGVSEYTKENGYKLVPAVLGNKVDYNALYAAVNSSVRTLETELNLAEADCYVLPEILDDNAELLAAIEQLNKAVNAQITYQVGSNTQILNADVFQPWLTLDENMQVTLNAESLDAFVKELGTTYNTCYAAKKLKTSYGTTVTISNSHYGWKVDSEAEKEAILAEIMSGEKVTRDLHYSMTANSHEGNDFGNSYVEINLTAQHLFMYVNGKLIVESDFVSGNQSKGWSSPTGAYGLTYKQKDATLNGADYSTPVDFWMPFAGNVGMHDATWRGDFGGSIYKRDGSHGCINLPWSKAKIIFENIQSNFPVLCYQLPGTETAKGIAQDQAYEMDKVIKAIGTVTLEKEPAILAARAQYDALSDLAKKYVKKYQTLLDAEAKLAELKAAIPPPAVAVRLEY